MPLKVFSLPKRVRFVLVSLALTSGLVFLTLPSFCGQAQWVCLLTLLSLLLVDLALGGTVGIEKFTLLLLPGALTLGAALSQRTFPNFTTLFKVAGWASFFLAMYTSLLAMNIFKVMRLKGEAITLQRAARPAVFLLCFVAAFLLLTTLHSSSLGVWLEIALVFLIGVALSLSFFWVLTLSDVFEKEHLQGAFWVGLGLVQVSIATTFYPWRALLQGLIEATFFYALLGVARAYFERHLKHSIVLEYIVIVLAVFIFARFL
jgi:hypothetical protein